VTKLSRAENRVASAPAGGGDRRETGEQARSADQHQVAGLAARGRQVTVVVLVWGHTVWWSPVSWSWSS
jgi:hypothetical protein